jgi:hypothetical protein
LYGATGLKVGGCTFRNTAGIWISNGSNNTVVAGSRFDDIGDAAIFIDSNILGTTIYGNTFKNIGHMHLTGAAVYSGSSSNTKILYNDVWGTGQYAFSFKGISSSGHVHNTCNYNYIQRTNRMAYDTGAIESLNRADADLNLNVIGNYIDDPGGIAISTTNTVIEPYQVGCVYLDDLSSNVTVRGNFMRNALWGHVFIHGGDDNLIENNIHILMPHETYVSTMHVNGNLTGNVNPERNTFRKNIYYSPVARTGQLWNLNALGTGNSIDNNIYCNIEKLGSNPDPGSTNDVNFDINSTVANPLFSDPAALDFRLQEASPAFAKGIVNLEWSRMGRIGYTASAAQSESLPRFWKLWADSPFLDFDYTSHPGLHGVEVYSRASSATRFNSRGLLVRADVNEPRFDHDPATQQPLGLLIEDSTTNLLAVSGNFTSSYWTKQNTTASSGGGTGLDGANSLSILTKTTEQGNSTQYVTPFPAGSYLTASVYLKKGASMDWAAVCLTDNGFVSGKTVWFNLATGVAGAAPTVGTGVVQYVRHGMTYMGRGIYKCVLTVQTNTIADASLQVFGDIGDGSYWGVVGGTTLMAAAQVEPRDHATSLVVTTNGAVNRAADVCYVSSTAVPGISFQGTGGSAIVEMTPLHPLASSAATILSLDDADINGSASDRVEISRTTSGTVLSEIVTAGASQAAIAGGTLPPSAEVRLAVAWKANDAVASVAGSSVGTDTSVAIPTGLSRLTLGARTVPGRAMASGHYRRVALFYKRIDTGSLNAL